MSDLTIDPELFARIELAHGGHATPSQGMCLMEAVAFLAQEQHSDRPRCVSPVLGAFGRGLNDVLPDDLRQELKALIPSLPGTAGDGMDEARSYMALDWLIRTWLPTWLDLVPACRADAARLRQLDRIADMESAERAGQVVRASKTRADAAATATGADADAAAWDAIGDAAWAATGAAARDAAATATGVDTLAAAWAAAWADALDAAGAATQAAAGAATLAAAEAAAQAATQPTVEELRRSAIDLYRDMIKDPR